MCFTGDRRVLEDIRLLAEHGYGEDRFGNNIIDAWLARTGIAPEDFSPLERLCYTGRRATGALEFAPTLNARIEESTPVEIAELVSLAQAVTSDRADDAATAMLARPDLLRFTPLPQCWFWARS